MKKQFSLLTALITLLVSTSVEAQTIVLDGVPIGITNPKEGHFTNLEATTQITLGSETITNFSGIDDDKVKVSDSDSPGNLEDQIVGGTGVTVNSDGSQITISAPPVNVEDSADGVEVTFAGEGEYDTGAAVVPALDLNGTNLVVNQTNPTVTVGGISSTVLASSSSPQQVIVRVPQGLNAGNYKLKVKNANGFSEGLIPLQQTFFDGSTWSEAISNAAFEKRNGHSSVVFDNKIWVIGGIATSGRKNDVWSSSDGVTWTQVTASAAWLPRYSHTSVVFDNKMWVLGGNAGSGSFNCNGSGQFVCDDVWYSTDGITWTEAATSTFPASAAHSSVVISNKMWVIAGYNINSGLRNDVWSSADGITWTQETSSANFSAREDAKSVTYDNKIWVTGGSASGNAAQKDVWYSSDGITWTQATANAAWPSRRFHSSVVYNNKMWVLTGRDSVTTPLNDVWSSTDGITWTQATAAASWAARRSSTVLAYDNKMWVIGGTDDTSGYNDVWFTSD